MTSPKPVLSTVGSSCKRCSTSIPTPAEGEPRLCAQCAARFVTAPKPTMNLHPVQEPAYVRGSKNFAQKTPTTQD